MGIFVRDLALFDGIKLLLLLLARILIVMLLLVIVLLLIFSLTSCHSLIIAILMSASIMLSMISLSSNGVLLMSNVGSMSVLIDRCEYDSFCIKAHRHVSEPLNFEFQYLRTVKIFILDSQLLLDLQLYQLTSSHLKFIHRFLQMFSFIKVFLLYSLLLCLI